MGSFSTLGKNNMLGGLGVAKVQLHSGDPGADGTSNVISDTLVAATFASASNGERVLQSDVTWTELTPSQSVTYFSIWDNEGTPGFLGSAAITGDNAANAAGDFTLKATTTKLTLTNPA